MDLGRAKEIRGRHWFCSKEKACCKSSKGLFFSAELYLFPFFASNSSCLLMCKSTQGCWILHCLSSEMAHRIIIDTEMNGKLYPRSASHKRNVPFEFVKVILINPNQKNYNIIYQYLFSVKINICGRSVLIWGCCLFSLKFLFWGMLSKQYHQFAKTVWVRFIFELIEKLKRQILT